MSFEQVEIDAAIETFVREEGEREDDLSNPVYRAICESGEGFEEACNLLSLRAARRFVDGDLSWEHVDDLMNWVWSRIVFYDKPGLVDSSLKPAISIFYAIDEGEYFHPGDSRNIDPVSKYTMPELVRILSESEPD